MSKINAVKYEQINNFLFNIIFKKKNPLIVYKNPRVFSFTISVWMCEGKGCHTSGWCPPLVYLFNTGRNYFKELVTFQHLYSFYTE